MDYRIKKVGDGWKFLPQKEREEKFEYERLLNKIKKREKKIESDLVKIGKLKKELRKMKSDRTKGFHKMVKYHKEFTPTFSTSLSKNPKYKVSETNKGSVMNRGNRSWTISVRIGGKRKPIYLGTQGKVNEMLDLIEGRSDYHINFFPHKHPPHEERIRKKIEKLVYPLIKRDLLKCLEDEGKLDSYMTSSVKGIKYLEELYLNSEYYEERKPMNPKFKGKFVTYNPMYDKTLQNKSKNKGK